MLGKKVAQNLIQEEAAFATLLANYDGYKRVFSPGATLTLTQSGLLAVLLERQRYAAIQWAHHRARREKLRETFRRTFASLLHSRRARTLVDERAKPLIGTVPRHS